MAHGGLLAILRYGSEETYKWQKPRMNFALYIISAAISIRRILYIISKKLSSSALLVFTEVDGGSILCVLYG